MIFPRFGGLGLLEFRRRGRCCAPGRCDGAGGCGGYLEILGQRVGQFDTPLPVAAVEQLVCTCPQNDSMPALSKQSPIEPMDGTRPGVVGAAGERNGLAQLDRRVLDGDHLEVDLAADGVADVLDLLPHGE
jgi:hypothetical protein